MDDGSGVERGGLVLGELCCAFSMELVGVGGSSCVASLVVASICGCVCCCGDLAKVGRIEY